MSPKARVLREADPEAASRLAAWAKEVTAGEFDEAARTFRVAEGKEDLFRTAAKLAGVELQWEEGENPGTSPRPGATKEAGNPAPSSTGSVSPLAIVVGVGLAALLAYSLLTPAR